MKLINTNNSACTAADMDYALGEIAYAVAVKKCLQTVVDEVEAISLIGKFDSYLTEGQKNRHLPSSCASLISRLT